MRLPPIFTIDCVFAPIVAGCALAGAAAQIETSASSADSVRMATSVYPPYALAEEGYTADNGGNAAFLRNREMFCGRTVLRG
jgi:hypothetical protein